MEFDQAGEEVPRVWSPWNPQRLHKANYWDPGRVFAAFHVYVHVAFLALVAEQRAAELEDTYGPLSGMVDSRRSLERAHYLGEKLKEQCWNQLGPAGQGLVDWLSTALEFLDSSPPPEGAYVHLCLDLYTREANQVAHSLIGTESGPAALAQALLPVAQDEVETARHVLSVLDAEVELRSFEQNVAGYAGEELGAHFPEVRRAIVTALTGAATGGYRLGDTVELDELVKEMVERSSESLYSVLSAYPSAVADAKRRAGELRFANSCHDDVGRLLAVLAAAVPFEGRILEIGTGAGVGTAWITVGLRKRSDVEVISLEVDAVLGEAAKDWPMPSYVQLVVGEAAQAIEPLGSFDLVFADAAPFKYDHIERVVEVLRPGGLLVVDDLEATPRTTELQRGEIDALRQTVLRHPELNAVELEWATGLLVAAKAYS
jgi:predicted O-methyltransferase YrrM